MWHMNNGLVIAMMVIPCIIPIKAYGFECSASTYCSSATIDIGETPLFEEDASSCKTGGKKCVGNEYVNNCTSCSSGYTLVTKNVTASSGCTITYQSCQIEGCEDCDGTCYDEDWHYPELVINPKYQIKVETSCNCGTCLRATSYRCAAGYYGTDMNCTSCPKSDDGIPTTSALGDNKYKSKCYAQKNKDGTNTTGTYQYVSDCFYSDASTELGGGDLEEGGGAVVAP